MSEVRKATPEQLAHLRELQEKWDRLTKRYGELHFQEKLVKQEKDAVDTALEELEAERIAAVEKLQQDFGSTGTINLQTGDFTPEN
jgi:hypothetical protein